MNGRDVLEPRRIKFHRYVGRIGVMFAIRDARDQFGEKGSSGREYTLSVWRNPR